MLKILSGDIFLAPAQALVNPVNCEGVSGAGLALAFKQRFPLNYYSYRAQCQNGFLVPGSCYIFKTSSVPKYIINFPTKDKWRLPSKLEYIDRGLEHLVGVCQTLELESLALPLLGCGKGGLNQDDVIPLIENYLGSIPTATTLYLG